MAKRAFPCLVLMLVVGSGTLGAIYLRVETRRVPVERLVANLEREAQADPGNVQTLINLARLHAMAFALKVEDFPASQRRKDQADVPFFPPGSGEVPDAVRPAQTPDDAARAAEHLKAAIRQYEAALKLSPDNKAARLGYGWVLQQAGERARAIDEYRRVVQLAWPEEQKTKMLMPSQRFYAQEAIGYLLKLLDPARDAAEIADLRSKQESLKARPRAITPIAIPLVDNLAPTAVADPLARVRFDADGSGLGREWTWIGRDAGWLVYDADGRGEVTSALQLFGNVSFWLFWSNGYEPMRALDDNSDGELAGHELKNLAVWQDRNSNGLSEPGEVRSLASHKIVSLSWTYVDGDGVRFAAVSPNGVRLADGRTRPTYDVILRHAGRTMTRAGRSEARKLTCPP